MLSGTKAEVKEERASRKAPLTDAEAKALVASVDSVVISRGKSSRTLKPKEVQLDDLRGPTGTFRAPMVRVGKTLLVGFNEEQLKSALR